MQSGSDEAPAAAGAAVVDATLRLPASAVSGLLREELELIARERAALAADAAKYEALKTRVAVTHFPTYVKLDVGGTVFKTSVSTLRAEHGSVLAAMFSSSGFDVTLNEDGAYFFDRDGTHFRHILNYLRGCLDVGKLEEGVRRELLIEADFYSLQGLVTALTVVELPFSGHADDENGLMNWLGTGRGSRLPVWTNPAAIGAVRVTQLARIWCNSSHGQQLMVARGSGTQRAGTYSTTSFGGCSLHHVTVELLDGVSIRPTHYSLRAFDGNNSCVSSNWMLEASAEPGGKFVTLKQHVGDASLKNAAVAAWAIDASPATQAFFRVFRFSTQGDGGCFHYGCFELYGTVHTC